MAYERIRIEPVAAALGAEVSGVDLTQPLDNKMLDEIQSAWMQHQVLFFRDQNISAEQHKAFAGHFGELHVHPVLPSRAAEGHPELVVLESNEHLPYVADSWHSDVTFERRPPLGSVLHGVIIPAAGGDTMWASMYAAYEALSDTMQRFLSSLHAVHDGGAFRAVATEAQKDDLAKDEAAIHPVIRTHPVTGRKALFVNSGFTRRIKGMRRKESTALLQFLFEHVTSPELSCRFRWRPHSIAMWDNRCTQHRVIGDNLRAHRRMERATICGDVPV
ncbi:MAG TPA: taurine dioxygenase [Candidatus Acidoferrales bacterium]|nr:taurine dioxygenase [Candidatus Acidoferrales bacterium]